MQQDPPHCPATADAAAVAEEGAHRGLTRSPSAARCAGRTLGSLRGEQLQEVYRARDVHEPPDVQEASGASRGGVRLRQLQRPSLDPLRRRGLLRGGPSSCLPIRLIQLGPLLPCGHQEAPRSSRRRISAVASRSLR